MPENITNQQAIARTGGGLSHPSKMPGPAWNIPAAACHTGRKYAAEPDTVCSGCYALRNNYTWPNVQQALTRRLRAISGAGWVPAMVQLVEPHRHFRWFDSGDLQGTGHLRKIFEVCRQTPGTDHWLPTRERGYVKRVLKDTLVPRNLALRLSMKRINQSLLGNAFDLPESGVSDNGAEDCPAHLQGNQCGRCRRCWDPKQNIIYRKH